MNDHAMTLAHHLGKQLLRQGLTITTAESCTGGGVSAAITEVSGSSAWFDAAFVTYSNAMKTKLLGVPADALERYGAVSEVVVEAMLQGALTASGAKLGVAVSGVAGPTGGTPDKPVGTVCFACGGQKHGIATLQVGFDGDRQSVREQSVIKCLELLVGYCERQD